MLQRSYNLLKEAARENEIHLIAMRQKSIHPTAAAVAESVVHLQTLCASVEVVENPWEGHPLFWYALVLSSLFTRNSYTVNWTRSAKMVARVQAALRNRQIDLVHYDTVALAEYIFPEYRARLVLNHHNIESDLILRRAASEPNILKRFYYSLEGRKLAAYEKEKCPLFQLNITVSELDSDILRKLIPGLAVTDIPNGVDVDFFKPLGTPLKKNSLVFAGSLDWYPNIKAVEFFCDKVWPQLKKAVPQATLLIVGRKPSAEFIERYSAVPGVQVLADVDDIRPYIDEAEVYICPIRHSGGTKLKVLDALAMGKAIVAHPVACEGIEVTDSVNALCAETPDEFVRLITSLFEQSSCRLELGRNGRDLIERKYSFKVIGNKLCSIYEKIGSQHD